MNNHPVRFDTIWRDLKPCLESIFKGEGIMAPRRYVEYYALIHAICTNQHSEFTHEPAQELYERLSGFVEDHARKLLQECQRLSGDQLLGYYNEQWTKFQSSSTSAVFMFSYLHRHWIKRNIDEATRPRILGVDHLVVGSASSSWHASVSMPVRPSLRTSCAQSLPCQLRWSAPGPTRLRPHWRRLHRRALPTALAASGAAAVVPTATGAATPTTVVEPRQSQTMQFFEMCAALIGALAR
ncbi:hypothetical protein niasHT_010050 [Heterodera trifolii]|uniref:Cullin N-terminal domain-containing protein n=1 Tax=Heterodera trifolii TaxID=157864 RepID=A0ABD2LYG4_9BILA